MRACSIAVTRDHGMIESGVRLPAGPPDNNLIMKNFINFIREQGVVGLAVGFILGGAVSKVVTAIVADLVNPVVGLALGEAEGLKSASLSIGPAQILYGDLVSVAIDFVIIALVVYFGVRMLKLDKLDKPKS